MAVAEDFSFEERQEQERMVLESVSTAFLIKT